MTIGNELLRDLFSAARGSENWYFNTRMFPGEQRNHDGAHPLIKYWTPLVGKDLNKCDDMVLLLNKVLESQEGE